MSSARYANELYSLRTDRFRTRITFFAFTAFVGTPHLPDKRREFPRLNPIPYRGRTGIDDAADNLAGV